MKKLLLIVVFMMAIVLFPMFAQGESEFQWRYFPGYEDGVFITGYSGRAQHVVFPSQIDGHRVIGLKCPAEDYYGQTVIGSAWEYDYAPKKITVSEGIRWIESGFFDVSDANGRSFETIVLPSTLEDTGDNFLFPSYSLKTIEFPNGSMHFDLKDGVLFSEGGERLIAYPNGRTNTQYRVPDGTKIIGKEAFEYCGYLAEVTLPEGLTTLEKDAFAFSGIQKMNIPSSVTEFVGNPFYTCIQLTGLRVAEDHPFLEVKDGVLFHKMDKRLIHYPQCLLYSVYIVPAGTRIIGTNAFNVGFVSAIDGRALPLETVILPDSIRVIEEAAFAASHSLREVYLPEGLEIIEENAFGHCYNLAQLTIPSTVKRIGSEKEAELDSGLIWNAEGVWGSEFMIGSSMMWENTLNAEKIIVTPGSYAEEYLKKHGKSYEYGAVSAPPLSDVSSPVIKEKDYQYTLLPDGTAKIIRYTGNSKRLTLPKKLGGIPVTAIGAGIIDTDHPVTSITVPEGIESIDTGAFSGCTLLQTVSLPKSLCRLEGSPFRGCDFLKEIKDASGNEVFKVEKGVLIDRQNGRILCFPPALETEAYDIPAGITSIAPHAFSGAFYLKYISFPRELTEIGEGAFQSSTVQEIALPEGLKSIGENAFLECDNLERAELPASLAAIGEGAFRDCSSGLIFSVKAGSYAEQYVLANGLAHTYHTQSTAGNPVDPNLRMIRLSDELSYGEVMWCKYYRDRIYVSENFLRKWKTGSRYDEASRTFSLTDGTVLGSLGKKDVLEQGENSSALVDLEKAAKILGLSFGLDEEGKITIRAVATEAELRHLIGRIAAFKPYQQYTVLDNPYYQAAATGTEIVDGITSLEWVSRAFKKATGNYDQEYYNQGLSKILLDTAAYDQIMKAYKTAEKEISRPLEFLNFLEKTLNEEDGALARHLKGLEMTEREIREVLGKWGSLFYEGVYQNKATETLMNVADFFEAADAVGVTDAVRTTFAMINYCNVCSSADAMSVQAMNDIFGRHSNKFMRNASERIYRIYQNQLTGGIEAGIRDWADAFMEKSVEKMTEMLGEAMMADKSLSIEIGIVKFIYGLVDKHFTHGSEYVDQIALNTVLCNLQREEHLYLQKCNQKTTGEKLELMQGAAMLYLRTLLAIHENGYLDYMDDIDAAARQAERDIISLLRFQSGEYGTPVDNQSFLDALIQRMK